MSGPDIWPRLRRRPPRLGKHRALLTTTETPLSPNLAASRPLHLAGPENALPVVPAEPERDVTCGNCGAIGPSSLIPEVPTRGPRCADVNACTKRWYAGKPVSLVPHGAEALEPLPEPETPVLPPVQEAALERFESAHAAQNAAEAGEDLSEDEGAAEEAEPAPVAAEDVTPDGGEDE
jgi:hypothetical protein